MRRFLAVFLALGCGAFSQTPWPGQTGNTVGYAAYGDGTLGTSACGAPSSGSAGNPTIISKCAYASAQSFASIHDVEFIQVDFQSGTSGLSLASTTSNLTFIGCRFQSNQIQFYNVQTDGTNIVFDYDSFTPLTSFYTSPPGLVWPSAGSGQNTTTQTDDVNAVGVNKGYEFGVLINSNGPVTIANSDFWGYGNAIVLLNTTAQLNFVNNWIHDAAQATGVTGGNYHTDGIGYLNGTAGPSHVWVIGNVIASLGNTNGMAFQAATSGYNDIQHFSNLFSGYGNTISPGDIGPTHFTNSMILDNTFSTAVEPVFTLSHGTTLGSNSVWACNRISFYAGTTWTVASWTPTSGMDNQFWLNTTSAPFNSTTDQGGNTVCPGFAPSSLSWQAQANGTTSIGKTVTLTNTGSSSLTGISVALQTGTQFSISSNTCGSSLATSSSCTVTVKFSPTSYGPQADLLQFTDNATSPSSPQSIPLLGVGCTSGTANCQTGLVPAPLPWFAESHRPAFAGAVSIYAISASR